MMRINCSLDDDSDANDPLGDIELVDSHGCRISQHATYLDDWLLALGECASAVPPADIEIEDEADVLHVEVANDAVSISYGDQLVHVSSLRELGESIHAAALRLISELRERTQSPLPSSADELDELVNDLSSELDRSREN